ncbi:hypothetical protein [Amycolatopsis minnesotensis]|uniref:DUF320 domain-containing protein n=1 Tax=Amycolatopsis minnesotensis TaxID=337894 RepID=A0ABP5E7K0_9PSEU
MKASRRIALAALPLAAGIAFAAPAVASAAPASAPSHSATADTGGSLNLGGLLDLSGDRHGLNLGLLLDLNLDLNLGHHHGCGC